MMADDRNFCFLLVVFVPFWEFIVFLVKMMVINVDVAAFDSLVSFSSSK